jgi:hypothetical protein
MYLFLSPSDSIDCFAENNSWEFTVTLPKTIPLTGSWVCALTEISYSGKLKGRDIYIFCDLCEGTCVQGRILPLLRIATKPETFAKSYYMSVSRSQISQVKIYIRDRNLRIPSFSSESLRCTLHLKKK